MIKFIFDIIFNRRCVAILKEYTTVTTHAVTEINIQKSRFITHVQRAETEEAALEFVHATTKTHWDATHNCFAYRIGKDKDTAIQKASDDGEPSGTAGKPILEVIRYRELCDTVVVVTRYFGGIKLGAAGLVRAYSQATASGLDAAGETLYALHRKMKVTVDYPAMGKVEYGLRQAGYAIESALFLEKVTWIIWVPLDEEKKLINLVSEQTSGQGNVTTEETQYREVNPGSLNE